jgi:hypothetical protein
VVHAARKLSRVLASHHMDQEAQLVDGLLDGALDEQGGIGSWPNAPPHVGGPDALYRYGFQCGWMLRRALRMDQQPEET